MLISFQNIDSDAAFEQTFGKFQTQHSAADNGGSFYPGNCGIQFFQIGKIAEGVDIGQFAAGDRRQKCSASGGDYQLVKTECGVVGKQQ